MKISIIGNGGGGKTTLAKLIAARLEIPIHFVDSIQFLPGMKRRPIEETRTIVDGWLEGGSWIIDGFGPLDSIEKRFRKSDTIVFVNFPLWRHYWWATKRQVKAFWNTREELPEGCSEAGWVRTCKLYRILWRVEKVIKPDLFRIIETNDLEKKVVWIKSLKDWNETANSLSINRV